MSVATSFLAPTWMTVPDWDYTLGPEVGELCTAAGFAPDGPQQLILDATFAIKDGQPAAFEVVIIGPRQNIKTGALKQIDLGFTFLMQQPLVVWSAHEVSTSTQSFRDLVELIETHDFLSRQVKRLYRPEGRERIELHGGGEVRFKARTRSGGRGLTGDKTILDEGFALRSSHLGALLPIMLTKRHGQVIYASSAGMADSATLRSLRDRGRRGDKRLAYFEYGDTRPNEGCLLVDCDHAVTREGCVLDDRERWWQILPALGTRVTEESVADLRRSMPPDEFAREVMGWWDDPGTAGGLFNLARWAARQDPATTPSKRIALAVHITPDRSWSSVAAASMRADGRIHVELLEHKRGTSWVLGFLRERLAKRRYAGIVIASGMAAGALAAELERLPHFTPLNGTEVRRACASLLDLVEADGRLAVRPHPDLDVSIEATGKSSQSGEWVFSAKPGVDLSPSYAVALAAHVARQKPAPRSDEELLESAH